MIGFKNIGLTGLLLATGAMTPAVMAQSIVLTQTAYSFADGGEFAAVTSPDNFAQYYAASALTSVNGQTAFDTFCVEASVYFSPGNSYSYTLGSVDSQNRALTQGAAWLYSQFAQGALTGYDYADNGAVSRNTDAGLLQSAIWYLQGDQTGGSSFPSGVAGNPFYTLAANTLGGDIEAAAANQFGVQLLDLSDSSQNPAQNQLVYDGDPVHPHAVGVPDHGATLALLALSLAGLAAFARGFGPPELELQRVRPPR